MAILDELKTKFPQAITGSHQDYGDDTVFVDKTHLLSVLNYLKKDAATPFDLLLDICGVDYKGETPRFEVVYHLYSMQHQTRLRIRVKVEESDPVVASAIKVWPAADWFEREAYDLLGIRFEGHPNLKRILTWNEFEGHPLRKDYPVDKRQPIPKTAERV